MGLDGQPSQGSEAPPITQQMSAGVDRWHRGPEDARPLRAVGEAPWAGAGASSWAGVPHGLPASDTEQALSQSGTDKGGDYFMQDQNRENKLIWGETCTPDRIVTSSGLDTTFSPFF